MERCESFSSISTYLRCPWRYKLEYVDELEVEETEAQRHGKEVHSAIERVLAGEEQELGEELQDEVEAAVHHYGLEGFVLTLDELMAGLIEKGVVQGYEYYFAFDEGLRPIPADSEDKYFHGYIDYLKIDIDKRRPSRVLLVDWKTGKSKGKPEQLDCYALYCLQAFKAPVVGEFFYVTTGEKTRRKYDTSDIERLKDFISDNIRAIRSDEVFSANPGILCNWCPFQWRCGPGSDVPPHIPATMSSKEAFEVLKEWKRKRKGKKCST